MDLLSSLKVTTFEVMNYKLVNVNFTNFYKPFLYKSHKNRQSVLAHSILYFLALEIM